MILIKPSIHSESQSPLISPFIYNTFPTSLGFLSGYLRQYNNVVPSIIDEHILPLEPLQLQELLAKDTGPKIVGITVITISSYRALQLAQMIKQIDSDYLVVLGGIHPTVLPNECLDGTSVDVIVRGEGEATFSELTRCIMEKRNYAVVRGISYKRNGQIIHNPNRDLIALDDLPPFPFDLFDSMYKHYRDFGTVISARGCPFDCIFCSQRAITGQRYRYVKNERVIHDIDLLIEKYKQSTVWFMANNFLVNKERAISLMDGMIKRGFHKRASFVAEMRGESVTDEILNKMKEANFRIASFGMETSSQRLLDLIDKRERVDDNIRAIRMANAIGIGTSATFIFGLPTERRAERLATARLARNLPLDDARFNVAVPYPGTKLYEIAKKEGRLHIKPHWHNFNVQFYMFGDDIPYVPQGTNRYQLMLDTFLANLMFTLRPKVLIKFFAAPISGGGVLTLPKRWYFSFSEIWKMIKLAIYILGRFARLLFLSMREKDKE
jgi:anaerobic magnesium-protoporphyrin IX monomethyl ester cyclase